MESKKKRNRKTDNIKALFTMVYIAPYLMGVHIGFIRIGEYRWRRTVIFEGELAVFFSALVVAAFVLIVFASHYMLIGKMKARRNFIVILMFFLIQLPVVFGASWYYSANNLYDLSIMLPRVLILLGVVVFQYIYNKVIYRLAGLP